MSISRMGNGRLRAQVWDPGKGCNVSVAQVIGPPASWPDTKQGRRDAIVAREKARALLGGTAVEVLTVNAWRDRWLTDPLFRAGLKEATTIYHRERTRAFAREFGLLPLDRVDDAMVARWLAGGTRNGQVPALRTMWNEARSAKAGRLVTVNPWANLGIAKGKGNAEKDPPPEQVVWKLIAAADKLAGPYMAAWLTVAAFTGMRPGELDALKRSAVDFQTDTIYVREQYSAASRSFTLPKNGRTREAILTPPARAALLGLPASDEWAFVTKRGTHFTASQRAPEWKAIKAAVGYDGTLYVATRHFFGWYAVNVLGAMSEDVAIWLGHTDGGDLVRKLYGHRDKKQAMDRGRDAFRKQAEGNVTPLRSIEGGAA